MRHLSQKNGYENNDAVSMENDDRSTILADIYKKLAVAEEQIQNGDLLDGEIVFSKLREKYD